MNTVHPLVYIGLGFALAFLGALFINAGLPDLYTAANTGVMFVGAAMLMLGMTSAGIGIVAQGVRIGRSA